MLAYYFLDNLLLVLKYNKKYICILESTAKNGGALYVPSWLAVCLFLSLPLLFLCFGSVNRQLVCSLWPTCSADNLISWKAANRGLNSANNAGHGKKSWPNLIIPKCLTGKQLFHDQLQITANSTTLANDWLYPFLWPMWPNCSHLTFMSLWLSLQSGQQSKPTYVSVPFSLTDGEVVSLHYTRSDHYENMHENNSIYCTYCLYKDRWCHRSTSQLCCSYDLQRCVLLQVVSSFPFAVSKYSFALASLLPPAAGLPEPLCEVNNALLGWPWPYTSTTDECKSGEPHHWMTQGHSLVLHRCHRRHWCNIHLHLYSMNETQLQHISTLSAGRALQLSLSLLDFVYE